MTPQNLHSSTLQWTSVLFIFFWHTSTCVDLSIKTGKLENGLELSVRAGMEQIPYAVLFEELHGDLPVRH